MLRKFGKTEQSQKQMRDTHARSVGAKIKEAAMFYFGIDFLVLILKRIVKLLEMAALASVAVMFILIMMTAMCG